MNSETATSINPLCKSDDDDLSRSLEILFLVFLDVKVVKLMQGSSKFQVSDRSLFGKNINCIFAAFIFDIIKRLKK